MNEQLNSEKLENMIIEIRREVVDVFNYKGKYTPNSIQSFIYTGNCDYLKEKSIYEL